MAEKLGNGGNGQESYDPATGRYVGNSKTVSKISDGVYGDDVKNFFDSLDDVGKNNFTQDFDEFLSQGKQTVQPTTKLTDSDIATYKANNPNLHDGEVDAAANAIREYEKIEPEITSNLIDIANDYGGMLIGLDHRMKSLDSTVKRMEKNGGGRGDEFDNEKALYGVKDLLRYTACFDEEDFDNSVLQMSRAMKQDYALVRILNSMKQGRLYKGINCLFTDGKGHVFEMQFHTPESIKVKDGIIVDLDNKTETRDASLSTSHDLYEQIREVKTRAKNGLATPQEIYASKKKNQDLFDMWNNVKNHPKIRLRKGMLSQNFKKRTNQ